MANISVSLPADGSTADVSDYNGPITTIVDEINGNLDNSNIKASAAIAGSKLANTSITAGKMSLSTTDWTPTITPQGAMTYTGVTTTAWYIDLGSVYYIWIYSQGTTGGTANVGFNITNLPANATTALQALTAVADVGGNDSAYAHTISATEIAIRRPGNVNWNLGADRGFILSGFIKKA